LRPSNARRGCVVARLRAFETREVGRFGEVFLAGFFLRAAGFFGELFFFFGLAMVVGAPNNPGAEKGRLIKNVSPKAQGEISALRAEAPNPKFQAPKKSQAPITNSPPLAFAAWGLELLWNLGFGIWNFAEGYELALE
jgi:hypothetical protein